MPSSAVTQRDIPARQAISAAPEPGLRMEWRDVERFLRDWRGQGHSPQAVERYRFCLSKFCEALPDDRIIRRGTVRQWREQLLGKGYAPATVNLYISACNTWLEYMGRREYQLLGQLEAENNYRTALTREEYFRLLLAARAQGQERLFLIVKVFGSTGLYANELANVTVEDVRADSLTGREAMRTRKIRLPEGLRRELLSYAEEEGIPAGPLFRTQDGGVLGRTTVAVLIRRLGQEAGLPDGRATPSGLRLMYLANRAELEADAARIVEQAFERQAAQEQLIVGWKV